MPQINLTLREMQALLALADSVNTRTSQGKATDLSDAVRSLQRAVFVFSTFNSTRCLTRWQRYSAIFLVALTLGSVALAPAAYARGGHGGNHGHHSRR